jgi:hypothetical protein
MVSAIVGQYRTWKIKGRNKDFGLEGNKGEGWTIIEIFAREKPIGLPFGFPQNGQYLVWFESFSHHR